MHYLALIASIAFNGTSIVLLKAFAVEREARDQQNAVTGRDRKRSFGSRLKLIAHPLVLLSMACFAAAAVGWVITLSGIGLSVAYASMSIIYVLTALAGRVLFQEHISPKRWVGIGLVVAGVALMYAG